MANEPNQIRSGATVEWTSTSGDYQADDGWTGKARLVGAEAVYDAVTAVADGDDYDFTISAATTGTYAVGTYELVVWAEKTISGTLNRRELSRTTVKVLADVSAVTDPTDLRSHARRTLALIESAIEDLMAGKPKVSITIAGNTTQYTELSELYTLRNKYKWEVRSEEDAENIAKGLGSRRRIFTRFDKAS